MKFDTLVIFVNVSEKPTTWFAYVGTANVNKVINECTYLPTYYASCKTTWLMPEQVINQAWIFLELSQRYSNGQIRIQVFRYSNFIFE
jgi:hypothetical protein